MWALQNVKPEDLARLAVSAMKARGAALGTGREAMAFSNDKPSTADLEREFKETERAYGGQDTYDLAKDAKRTKLTYGQWVMVRTPRFKAWFGDWGGARAQQRLDAMDSVDVPIPDSWRGLSEDQMRDKMAEALDVLVTSGEKFAHAELGEVRVGRRGQKKTVSTSKDPADMLVARSINKLLPQALYARAAPSSEQGVLGYAKLLLPVRVDGLDLVAVLTVRRQADGVWYYNTVTVENASDQKTRPGSYASSGAIARPLEQTPITGLADFVRQPLARVNPATVSKVTDPDTGEPMVVYKGGPTENWRDGSPLVAFDSPNGPWAGFFTSSPDVANRFANAQLPMTVRGGAPAGVFSTFIAMSRPLVVDAKGKPARVYQIDASVVGKPDHPIRSQLTSGDYDGLMLLNTEDEGDVLAPLRPEQIKSATGNTGAFDGTNPDIRYSRGPGPTLDPDTLRGTDTSRSIQERIRDHLTTHRTFNWWHRTVAASFVPSSKVTQAHI